MKELIYIYVALNCFIAGGFYEQSAKKLPDRVTLVLILLFGFLITVFEIVIHFSIQSWHYLEGLFQISFIWRIRNGYYKNFTPQRLKQLYALRDRLLEEEKEKSTFRARRLLYCMSRIEKYLEAEKNRIRKTEISGEEIFRLIDSVAETNKPIILDIGSYDGKHARMMSSQFHKCEVHCFEADKRSRELFLKECDQEDDIFLYPYALCHIDGEIEFYLSDSNTRRHKHNPDSWSASSSIKPPLEHLKLFPDVQFNQTMKVKSKTLDTWYAKYKQNHSYDCEPVIDFIWADVNGGERELIEGGLKTLNERARYLYIEFSDKELYQGAITKQQILDMLPEFEAIGVYNYRGNFGNVLLRNKKLTHSVC